jgi:hypothetical protein
MKDVSKSLPEAGLENLTCPNYPFNCYTILDFRFWILDWGMPDRLTIPEIEIIQVQTKMA